MVWPLAIGRCSTRPGPHNRSRTTGCEITTGHARPVVNVACHRRKVSPQALSAVEMFWSLKVPVSLTRPSRLELILGHLQSFTEPILGHLHWQSPAEDYQRCKVSWSAAADIQRPSSTSPSACVSASQKNGQRKKGNPKRGCPLEQVRKPERTNR